MSDFTFLNLRRLRHGPFASNDSDGFNGVFFVLLYGAKIKIIASDQEGWKHVSVSIEKCIEPPNWKMMCAVKDLFWDDEDVVIQYHPKKSEYVNTHPGCLHLWQPLGVEIPTPPANFVGIKS
jgi:hypothetical protein